MFVALASIFSINDGASRGSEIATLEHKDSHLKSRFRNKFLNEKQFPVSIQKVCRKTQEQPTLFFPPRVRVRAKIKYLQMTSSNSNPSVTFQVFETSFTHKACGIKRVNKTKSDYYYKYNVNVSIYVVLVNERVSVCFTYKLLLSSLFIFSVCQHRNINRASFFSLHSIAYASSVSIYMMWVSPLPDL